MLLSNAKLIVFPVTNAVSTVANIALAPSVVTPFCAGVTKKFLGLVVLVQPDDESLAKLMTKEPSLCGYTDWTFAAQYAVAACTFAPHNTKKMPSE